jgi:hypothetical protein
MVTVGSVCEAVTASVDTLDVPTHLSDALVVVHFQSLYMACSASGDSTLPVYLLDESYRVKAILDIPD